MLFCVYLYQQKQTNTEIMKLTEYQSQVVLEALNKQIESFESFIRLYELDESYETVQKYNALLEAREKLS